MEFIGLTVIEWFALGFFLGIVAVCIILDSYSYKQKQKELEKRVDFWI